MSRYLVVSITALVLMLTSFGSLVWSQDIVVMLSDIGPDDLQSVPFTIRKRAEIHITAVGARRQASEGMFAYPWIIDARSREMVWSMDEEFTQPVEDSDLLQSFDDVVSLRPGVYELYYQSGRPFRFDGEFENGDLGDLLEALGAWLERSKRGADEESAVRDLTRRYYVRLTADSDVLASGYGASLPKPAVDLTRPDNDAYLSRGFSLQTDMDLNVYAIGEYSKWDHFMVDYGWIINARTREPVWRMSRANTRWAGGADKNRMFHDQLTFPKGDYIAYYVTDGSHTYEDWNATPPFDPEAWGLQIFVQDPALTSQIQKYTDVTEVAAIVRLTRIGDNELVSESFRVEKSTKLRIYALGEYDRFSDKMADYAWITHRGAKKKIWVMTGDQTDPAGGDKKNRRFDGLVAFDPGEYTVYYISDGSHSYRDGWNATPPLDQKSYGVTVFPGDAEARTVVVALTDVTSRPDALAEIVGVRDKEKRHVRFTLTSPTRINIYALGEGTRHGMADYGWIENESTGDIVWEMTYRKTSHAGGAEKNRMVNQNILLDKGEYVVYYITDNSHAFGDWNTDPPDDPANWGILLTRVERAGD